jgi:hypothetical protein
MTDSNFQRIFNMPFASVYPHYIGKIERKGRTKDELDTVIRWLTGYSQAALDKHIVAETTLADFFAKARLHKNASKITGVVCGVRVEAVPDPLMRKIRLLDKVVDELAKGRTLDKILRT